MDNELDKVLDGVQDQDPCKGQSYADCLLSPDDSQKQLDEMLDDYPGNGCDPNLDANCYGPQTCDPRQDPFCYDRGYPDNGPGEGDTGSNADSGGAGSTGPCDPSTQSCPVQGCDPTKSSCPGQSPPRPPLRHLFLGKNTANDIRAWNPCHRESLLLQNREKQ
jgi:hypothetical protein